MTSRVTTERMTQLRQQSKLRERLALEVNDLNQRLQAAFLEFNNLVDENTKLSRHVITYDIRQQMRRQVEANIQAKSNEIIDLRARLATAIQELEDYDQTTNT